MFTTANSDVDGCVSEGAVSSNVGFGRGWFKDDAQSPQVGILRTPRLSSTRLSPPSRAANSGHTDNVELSTLISDLANQIGQSIAAQIQNSVGNANSQSNSSFQTAQSPPELNLSGVKLVMQSDVREPPVYRGDGSDKCSVYEWVEMVELFLSKKAFPVQQQKSEVLAKLLGKARDVVTVTLRNLPLTDDSQTPSVIFDILKQHFGELAYSAMPMADFYDTKPLSNESVMDYWIRLNKAIDVADECLRRQGRGVVDPGREVSMMFIKYCPDPVLANRLSFKSAEEWTTAEVQERITVFQRESRASSRQFPNSPRVVTSLSQSAAGEHACGATEKLNTLYSAQQVSTQPPQHSVPLLPSSTTLQPQISSAPALAASTPVFTQPSDLEGVRSLTQLLDCLVARYNPASSSSAQHAAPDRFPRSCKICGDPTHSTLSHCRRNNLCLSCFSPGHWKKNCPRRNQPPSQSHTQDRANQTQSSGN